MHFSQLKGAITSPPANLLPVKDSLVVDVLREVAGTMKERAQRCRQGVDYMRTHEREWEMTARAEVFETIAGRFAEQADLCEVAARAKASGAQTPLRDEVRSFMDALLMNAPPEFAEVVAAVRPACDLVIGGLDEEDLQEVLWGIEERLHSVLYARA